MRHPPDIFLQHAVDTLIQPKTASNLSDRQKAILEHARKYGEVEVDPLAQSFSVTPQTIRRDLNQLCDATKFQRECPVRIGNISDMDYFVTDIAPPVAFMDICRTHDVQVEVTGPELTTA